MFAKNSAEGGGFNKEVETVIGSSVKVEGNFVCEGNMVIDGEVKGNVQTSGSLQIGAKAGIFADIKAGSALIAGHVEGNVKVDGYLELTPTARLNGDVVAEQLSMAKGAILNGHCSMTGAAGKSQPLAPTAADEATNEEF